MEPRQRWIFGTTQAIAFGVPFAVFAGLGRHLSVTAAVVSGLSAGVVFGAGMTWIMVRTLNRLTTGLRDGLTAAEVKQVLVASVRGPIPSEDRLIAAAAEISRRRVAMVTRRRPIDLGTRIVMMVIGAILAVTLHPLWWLVTALFAVAGVLNGFQVRRVRQRSAVLDGVVAALRAKGPAS